MINQWQPMTTICFKKMTGEAAHHNVQALQDLDLPAGDVEA